MASRSEQQVDELKCSIMSSRVSTLLAVQCSQFIFCTPRAGTLVPLFNMEQFMATVMFSIKKWCKLITFTER